MVYVLTTKHRPLAPSLPIDLLLFTGAVFNMLREILGYPLLASASFVIAAPVTRGEYPWSIPLRIWREQGVGGLYHGMGYYLSSAPLTHCTCLNLLMVSTVVVLDLLMEAGLIEMFRT